MAPAADMPTPTAMAQSFSLANMVPQAPKSNSGAWAKIEKDTRQYVKRAQGDVFVITGPAYGSAYLIIGDNQVRIPQYLYKLVYDPSKNKVWAYWQENKNDARASAPISYDELVRRTGIVFLPAASMLH
jgi:endonuclease G